MFYRSHIQPLQGNSTTKKLIPINIYFFSKKIRNTVDKVAISIKIFPKHPEHIHSHTPDQEERSTEEKSWK